jgi:hypothetical protein
MCGKETISWDLYVKASRFLIREVYIDKLDTRAWKSSLGIGIRDDTRKTLLPHQSKSHDDTKIEFLMTNLTHIRHLQATNPKDKIYGLYGVLSTLGVSLPAPDYGKSLEKIYEEACLAIILHSKSLQILEYACSNARALNLPSWVVDLQDEDVILITPRCNATDGSRISQNDLATLSPAYGQLRARGIVLGPITTRAEHDFATLDFPSASLPMLQEEKYDFVGSEVEALRLLVHRLRLFREWMHLVSSIPSPYEGDSSIDLFHKLLTFNCSGSYSPFLSPSTDTRLFNAWTDILQYPDTTYTLTNAEKLAETWKNTDSTASHPWAPELFHCVVIAAAILLATQSQSSTDPHIPTEMLDFTAHLCGDLGNRALILVHDPLLEETVPGTAFHTASVGDVVVLLEGADNPVVLRRKGEEWVFVGTAFVVGSMEGEGWLEEDLEDFVLV